MKSNLRTKTLMLLAAAPLFQLAACSGGSADKTPTASTVSDQGKTATTPVEQQPAPDDTKFVAAFASRMKDRGEMVDVATLTNDFKAAFPSGRPVEVNAQMVSWIYKEDPALQSYASGFVSQAREMNRALIISLGENDSRLRMYGMMSRVSMSKMIENFAYLSYGLTYTMVTYLKDFGYDVSVNTDYASYSDQVKEAVANYKAIKEKLAAEAGSSAPSPVDGRRDNGDAKKENIEDNLDNVGKAFAGASIVYKDGNSSGNYYWYKAIDLGDELSAVLAGIRKDRSANDNPGMPANPRVAGTSPIELTWDKADSSVKNPILTVFSVEKKAKSIDDNAAAPAGPAPAAKAPAQAAPASDDNSNSK